MIQFKRFAFLAGDLVVDVLEVAPIMARGSVMSIDANLDHTAARSKYFIFRPSAHCDHVDIVRPPLGMLSIIEIAAVQLNKHMMFARRLIRGVGMRAFPRFNQLVPRRHNVMRLVIPETTLNLQKPGIVCGHCFPASYRSHVSSSHVSRSSRFLTPTTSSS